MVIFQYNVYIFGIHLWTVLYPKLYYNELCYKEVVYLVETLGQLMLYLYKNLLELLQWGNSNVPTVFVFCFVLFFFDN